MGTGSNVGHYRLAEKLGEGGMGIVYKARDLKLGRAVAIKVLPPEKVDNAERRARFVQEARAASSLNHPNIVTIYEIGHEDGTDFIAMEYVAGTTLDKLIPKSGMPVAQVLGIAVQLADALSKAHGEGIVHRDLKPANIIVSAEGFAKILDFGLAKLLTPAIGETDNTRTVLPGAGLLSQLGSIAGTAAYMSPEQAEGKAVDGRSDIFSLGAVLYEMIAGRRAFEGESFASIVASLLRTDPPPPLTAGPELSGGVMRCLKKQPADRFPSATDLRASLRTIQAQTESGGAAGKRAAESWRLAIIGASIAAAVGSGVFAWFRTAGEPTLPVFQPYAFTSYPGNEFRPGISPDGTQVAFYWQPPGQPPRLYVKRVNVEPPRRLTAEHPSSRYSENLPVWSPDGKWIVFARRSSPTYDLFVIPAEGGPERLLAAETNWRGLSWSPDGKWIAFTKNVRESSTAIFLVEVATGTTRPLTHPGPGTTDQWPAYSSDGSHVAFARSGGGDGESGNSLHWVAVGGEAAEQRLGAVSGVGSLAWIPGTPNLLVSSRTAEGPRILKVSSLSPHRVEALQGIGGGQFDFLINGIGVSRYPPGRLVYETLPLNRDVWVANLDETNPGRAQRLIASTRQDDGARFSPDGSRISFRTNRSGRPEIWVSSADGSGEKPLTPPDVSDPSLSPGSWSADGRSILFSSRNRIFAISAEGGPVQRIDNDDSLKRNPLGSADGRFIYFLSSRSGSEQIWKMPAGGGPAMQVTRNGATEAVESADGAALYVLRSNQVSGIWKIPLGGGAETLIHPGLRSGWTLGPKGLYGIGRSDKPEYRAAIHHFDATFQKSAIAAYLEKVNGDTGYQMHVSADGKRMLFTIIDTSGGDLMMADGVR